MTDEKSWHAIHRDQLLRCIEILRKLDLVAGQGRVGAVGRASIASRSTFDPPTALAIGDADGHFKPALASEAEEADAAATTLPPIVSAKSDRYPVPSWRAPASTQDRCEELPESSHASNFPLSDVLQEQAAGPASPGPDALGPILSKRFKAYGANVKRSVFQLATTATAFVTLLAVMAVASHEYYWLTLLLALPAAGFLVRLFIIQHDCGHGSYFKSRAANDLLGRVLSVATLTPYGSWSQGHAAHHASTGNLDRRGRGDVETWTVAEYEASSRLKRLAYRLYRNPFVMVILGAPMNFIVLQRLPVGHGFRDRDSRRSIMALNLALIGVFGPLCAALGLLAVLGTYLPVMVIASWVGNWLFYVQHQFDRTHWERDRDWSFHAAALSGSSYFKLPPVLQWFTGNIGLHHIHHLSSRVPNYRLQACLDAAPELHRVTKIVTLRQSLKCWRLALWDENSGLLVGFRDLEAGAA